MDRTVPSIPLNHDANVETSSAAAPIDFDRAVDEFAGKRALVERLLDRFVDELRAQVPVLQTALAADDWETLRQEAHRTRGGAANLTAVPMASAAAQVEGSAESCDRAGVEAGLVRLLEEIERLGRYVSTIDGGETRAECPARGRGPCES